MLRRGGKPPSTSEGLCGKGWAFDPEPAIANEKSAILSLIAQWEAGLPDTVTDLLDFNNHD
jgi:hypothetical protein